MCREYFSSDFTAIVDKNLQAYIAKKYEQDFDTRKNELIASNQWSADKIRIRFLYGNEWNYMPNTKVFAQKNKCSNNFTMFLELCHPNKWMVTEQIEKVVYNLHDTYKKPVQTVDKYPFRLSKNAWGSFEVEIEIYWKKWLGLPVKKMNHMLLFERSGKSQNFVMTFKSKDFESKDGASFLEKYLKQTKVEEPIGVSADGARGDSNQRNRTNGRDTAYGLGRSQPPRTVRTNNNVINNRLREFRF